MRVPSHVKASPRRSNLSKAAVVLALSLVAAGLSNLPTPVQASTHELICSKTSNATRTSEATSVTDTTLRLSITGTELMRGWQDSDWGFACAGEVIIPEGITKIDMGYFVPWDALNSPLSNNYLTSIVWPTTVQEIHIGLINLRGLTILDIPSSVSAISAQSFQSLSSLTDTNIQGPTSAANTLTLNQYVFNETVTSLTIGNGYVNFGASFNNGAIFTSVKLGPNVRSIGDRAFAGTNDSRSFTSIEIPTGLTTIGAAAFAHNPYLKTVSFGTGKPGITSIAADAFAGTTVIERVEYCGLIDPTLSNPTLEAYLAANLPSVPVYCSTNFPKITNLSPSIGSTAGGELVTVEGANLTNARVYVDGAEVTVTNGTDRSLGFTTPVSSAGAKTVTVTTTPGSASSCFTYGSATSPSAPTISSITPGGNQLSVAFTPPTCLGDAAITNYDYSIDNGANWITPSTASTSSPLVITGLSAGKSHRVKIKARNSANAGTASNGVFGTPTVYVAPPPPTSNDSSAPPSSEVAALSVRGSSTGNSSVVRIKLTKPPLAGEQMYVKVRLLSLDGKVIEEVKVPVNSNTSTIEFPVKKAIGAFNAVVATSNNSSSSSSMSLAPQIVEAETVKVSKNTRAERLMGTSVSGNFTFTPNSAVLSPVVKKSLREAALAAKASNSRVAVTGFAAISGRGSIFERYVAKQRALAVSDFLRKQGVQSWIYYKGFSGPEGLMFQGQPRRVEIRILK